MADACQSSDHRLGRAQSACATEVSRSSIRFLALLFFLFLATLTATGIAPWFSALGGQVWRLHARAPISHSDLDLRQPSRVSGQHRAFDVSL